MNKTVTPAQAPGTLVSSPAEPASDAASRQSRAKGPTLTWPKAILLIAGAAAAFNLAYAFSGFLIAVYLWCLFRLTDAKSTRQAFYFGLAAGYLACAPQSGFLWNIFGPVAIALWFILAFWIGLFVAVGRLARVRFGPRFGLLLMPFLWTGLEYFRSELYYLRFSWLNVGYVFANQSDESIILTAGVYGAGFLIMAAVAWSSFLSVKKSWVTNICLLGFLVLTASTTPFKGTPSALSRQPAVAGVQLEFANEPQVISSLDKLVQKYPNAQLLLLSEYAFAGPLPDSLKDWCRRNKKFLVAGAENPAPNNNYYDTAFVISPTGEILFHQAKCVPIQFFKDGLPAREQKLWDSPWGRIGFCVCYDLSYTRVTDELVRLGAQAIIVPTMDVEDWGRHQHELHARVAPTRVAEYGIPVYRLASSGISQFIDRHGMLIASAPMPGPEAMLCAPFEVAAQAGHLPWDRPLAKISVAITALSLCWFVFCSFKKPKDPQPKPS